MSRPNSLDQLITKNVPDLRIVEDELWQAVKDRQRGSRNLTAAKPAKTLEGKDRIGFWTHQRPKHLLTGLARCGCCGGGYTKISATLLGCAAARNKGTCDNRLNVRVEQFRRDRSLRSAGAADGPCDL